MSLYTSVVVGLPYAPHGPCHAHDDCAKNAELAAACGMANEPKPYAWSRAASPSVAVLSFRKVETSRYYTPGETTPRDSSLDERDVTVERNETTGQITYKQTRHTEHRVFESYTGSVVKIWSDPNGRIMSDVWGTIHYADVIEASGELHTYRLGDCEFGTGDMGGLENAVDVTPEAWERNRLFNLRQSIALETEAADRAAAKIAADKFQAAKDAVAPRKGARVKVVGARGKGAPPKGSVGDCFWVGESTFNPRRGPPTTTKRVGIVIDGVKFFTAASNVVLA